MTADSLMRHRDAVAMLPAIVVLALLATASVKQIVKLKDNSEPMTVSLYEEPPPEELSPPPQPQPRVMPPEPMPPRPQPQPQQVEPAPAPVATQPAEPIAAPAATAPIQAPAPPSPPIAAPVSAPPTAHATNEALEAAYVAKLRTYLNSIKRYPTSREARQQHPQGKVRLWLELARDGALRNVGIDETSGSMILDGAAQSTVRQGNYPAFPDEMWAGKPTHRFAVTLEYVLDG